MGGLAVNWRQTAKENKWLESYISEESLQIFLLFLHFSAVFQQYSRVSFSTPPKSIHEGSYTWSQGSHQCERDPFRFSGLVQAGVLWKHCLYQKRRLWYIFHMVRRTGETNMLERGYKNHVQFAPHILIIWNISITQCKLKCIETYWACPCMYMQQICVHASYLNNNFLASNNINVLFLKKEDIHICD